MKARIVRPFGAFVLTSKFSLLGFAQKEVRGPFSAPGSPATGIVYVRKRSSEPRASRVLTALTQTAPPNLIAAGEPGMRMEPGKSPAETISGGRSGFFFDVSSSFARRSASSCEGWTSVGIDWEISSSRIFCSLQLLRERFDLRRLLLDGGLLRLDLGLLALEGLALFPELRERRLDLLAFLREGLPGLLEDPLELAPLGGGEGILRLLLRRGRLLRRHEPGVSRAPPRARAWWSRGPAAPGGERREPARGRTRDRTPPHARQDVGQGSLGGLPGRFHVRRFACPPSPIAPGEASTASGARGLPRPFAEI